MRLRLIPVFLVLVVCSQVVQCQAGASEAGSTALILTYTCQPAQRLALREHMASVGHERLEQFKAQGVLTSYRILFSRYVDNENWDMMLTLWLWKSLAEGKQNVRVEKQAVVSDELASLGK